MTARLAFYGFLAALGAWLAIAARTSSADPPPVTTSQPLTSTVERTLQGLTVTQWHGVAARYLNRVRSLQHVLHADPETSTAIGLACVVYGHCSELWRKARCESNYHRYSVNSSSGASGLFQFLPSTWRSTPFGRYSIFDPYANALGAGWMHTHGRGGEWVCQ